MSNLIQDIRYALRTLARVPAVTLVAVVSLAVGLGAAAGATSLLDALGFRPPAVAFPDSLAQVRSLHDDGGSGGQMSYLDYKDLADRAGTFSALSFYSVRGAGLSGPEAPPELVLINLVSSNYFQTLGVTPTIGRPFLPEDFAGNAPMAVVVSHRVWQRRFGGDQDVLRRTMFINGVSCDIVGVAPAAFTGLDAFLAPDVWIPATKWSGGSLTREPRDTRSISVIGRLKSPVSTLDRVRAVFGVNPPAVVRAQQDVDVIVSALSKVYPHTNRDERASVVPILTVRTGGLMTGAILLWAIVALVLLVGCANVAGLLLGRAESRRQELAIRAALGAGRRRLVRQLLTESVILALLSGGAGLLLSAWIIHALPALLPPMGIPLGFVFQLDRRVVLATTMVAMATSLVFGLWPALAASRRGIIQAARGDATRGRSTRKWSARNVLVVGQVAASLVLITSGVLLVRSAQESAAINPGFRLQPLLLVSIAPAAAGYSGPRSNAFFDALVERASAAPGIRAVSVAQRIPLDPNGGGAAFEVAFPGQPAPANGRPITVKFDAVAPNYFEVMGTRVTGGRAFTRLDGHGAPKVVVVNETMAKHDWPHADAVGQRVIVTGPDVLVSASNTGEYEVVGVVEDGKINNLIEPAEPYMFFSLAQMPSTERTLIISAIGDPGSAAPIIRGIVNSIDPHMPTMKMITLAEHMRYALYGPRLAAIIVGSLSTGGLLLSLIGLYGVVSFVVARRTREIGVRMAIGAQPGDILREMLWQALGLTLWGIGLGVPLALLVAHLLAGSLYGVSPTDPATFIGVAAVLILVALAASYGPARRAMKVDPAKVLSAE